MHRHWLEGGSSNFDLILSPYQPVDGGGLPSFPANGYKWKGLRQILAENDFWREYDYICFPDDDLSADAKAWSAFFNICAELKAKLAQPSLTRDSFFSHMITLKNERFFARETNFVEVMTPCFSRDFLVEAFETLILHRSGNGHGLDLLWPMLLAGDSAWIIDEISVRHARPIGENYNREFACLAAYDMRFAGQLSGSGVGEVISFGGILREGGRVTFNDSQAFDAYLAGYEYMRARIPDLLLTCKRAPAPAAPERLKTALAHVRPKPGLISRGKPSRVSSVSSWSWSEDPALEASGGNDGFFNGYYGFHTALEVDPWWQVDLLEMHQLEKIVIYNRLDVAERCRKFDVLISDDERDWRRIFRKVDESNFGGFDGRPLRIEFSELTVGRFVRVQAPGWTYLHLDQIEIFGVSLGRSPTA